MEGIMKIVKSYKDSGLFLNRVGETIQNELKKGGFLGTLLGTLGVGLLGNMLTGKGITWAGSKEHQAKKGKGIIRAVYESKGSLIRDF